MASISTNAVRVSGAGSTPPKTANARKAFRVPRKHPEDDLQIAVMQWLDLMANAHSFIAWHVPNGGKRNKREAARLKGMGVKAGIPDVHILKDGRLYLIELKAGRGVLSELQKQRIERLIVCGALCITCRSLDEVMNATHAWGITP